MRRLGLICLSVAALAAAIVLAYQQRAELPGTAKRAQRRVLRVALYPFIPEFSYAAETVKLLYEAENPDVELTIWDLSANYYAPDTPDKPDPTFIGRIDSDIYELDSVFLADFIREKKIQPLPDNLLLPESELLKNAYAGSMFNGRRYGSAHWVCRNFLFFTSAEPPSRPIKTLKDLEVFIGSESKLKLLLDMRGRLTLGEFYLGAAYARYKDWAHVSTHLDKADQDLESDLIRVLKLCPTGGCRDQIFHELTGIYGQQFSRKRSRALIGYSELLHSVLTEQAACGTDCIADSTLRVSELPLDDAGAVAMSWVDSFTISSACVRNCFEDASRFLRFMQRDDVYLKLLLPERPSFLKTPAPMSAIPAYLLPAKASLYSNQTLLSSAHLYPELRTLVEGAAVPIAEDLNKKLRTVSKDVDSALEKSAQ
jgi:thiamine pyridinylase